jgi:aminomethyltransferase
LATLLAHGNAPPELEDYCGVLTARKLDALERETAALLAGAAAHDLGWMRRVAVRGEDRLRWLSGMVTNTVYDLAVNSGAWNLVLNPQGHIQGDLYVWREGGQLPDPQQKPVATDTLTLEIAANQYDQLLAHMDHFIIMDDVELTFLAEESALGLTGPLAADLLMRLGLPDLQQPLTSISAVWNGLSVRAVRAYGLLTPHYELWVKPTEIPALWRALLEAGATPAGFASIEAVRIAEGIPAYGVDIVERDLPQETSQMRTLCFNKGCYLGQAIVERIRSRGNVHKHLRHLELFGPVAASGTQLTLDGGAAAGTITSAAELPLSFLSHEKSSDKSSPESSSAEQIELKEQIEPKERVEPKNRVFALGMIRGEAELRNQPFNYTAGTATGAARILTVPPSLDLEQIGSRKP